MTPLATYEERRPWWRKTFELYSDRLVVRYQRAFGSHAEETVRLSDLMPTDSRVWVKDRAQHRLILLSVILGCVGLLLALLGAPSVFFPRASLLWSLVGAVVSALGFVFFDPRRIEYVHFRFRAGGVLLVGRLGPHKDRFGGFVQALRDAIERAAPSSGAA